MKLLVKCTIVFLLAFLGSCGSGLNEKDITTDSINTINETTPRVDKENAINQEESPTQIERKKSVDKFWQDVIKRQTNLAKGIIHGRVKDISAERGRTEYGDEYVESSVSLEVIESLKGNFGSRLEFKSLGGVIGELLYSYSHIPIFSNGEEVIIFLKSIDGTLVTPVGWIAAKLSVRKNRTVIPSSISIETIKTWIENESRGES